MVALMTLVPSDYSVLQQLQGACPLDSCYACAVCQVLRIISFTVTQLPGPNYHCRGGEPTAVREMPEQWWGHVVVDIRRQVSWKSLALRHIWPRHGHFSRW